MTAYFVKNGGNDAASGLSDANAWETIPKVNTEFGLGTFNPGDTISFKRGDTWLVTNSGNRLNIGGVSGTIGNPIVVGAYGTGARPIFDANANHTRVVQIASVDFITFQDIEVVDWFDSHGIEVTDCEHVIVQRVYVHDMTKTSWGAGITVGESSRHCWILDSTITDVEGEGIYFGTGDDPTDLTKQCWVKGCTIKRCSEGIEIKDATTEIFVTDCALAQNGVGGGLDIGQISLGGRYNVIYNCTITGTNGANRTGIYMGRYDGGVVTNSGNNCTVERCRFKDCTGTEGAIRASGTAPTNNKIINCTFVDCLYGIYCNAGAAGYEIRNCIFHSISGYAVNMQVAESRYDFDYNKYSDGDTGVWFESGSSRNLAAYVQGTLGQETNGDSNAANFAETGMYTLALGSDAINSGDSSYTVYDWNDEYGASGSVDQGWREYDAQSIRENLGGHPRRTFISIHDESAAFGRYTGTMGIGVSVAGNVPTPIQGKRNININVSTTADRYAYRTGLGNLKHFYVSFEVDADSLTMANGDEFNIFEGLTSGSTTIMRIQMDYDGSNKRIRAGLLTDAAAWTNTSYYDLSSGWNHITVLWSSGPDTSINDGQVALWLNDTEKEHIDSANNHDNTVDEFRIGTVNDLDAGTTGFLYIDMVRLDWLRYMNTAISTTTYVYVTT